MRMNNTTSRLLWSLMGLLTAVALFSTTAWAQERILNYESDIQVHRDSTVTVVENITVRAENNNINHGIYRDFPTIYRGKYGLLHVVGFQFEGALKNGRPEPWFLQDHANGKRVYIGRKNHILRPGVYTYTLKYSTNRQLGFFKDHDELYWNVTGNGWSFPIDRVTARVHLPAGAGHRATLFRGFTGAHGNASQHYTKHVSHSGTITYKTTIPLGRHEGFTIVAGWPKGYVKKPSLEQQLTWMLRDNRDVFFGFTGWIILLFYYLLVWGMAGKDPDKGIIIPRFTPPRDLSPASMRFFLTHGGMDDRSLSSAVVNLAVKGFLRIEENNSGTYTLVKQRMASNHQMSPEEKLLFNSLFESVLF